MGAACFNFFFIKSHIPLYIIINTMIQSFSTAMFILVVTSFMLPFLSITSSSIPRRTIQTVLNRFKTEFDFYYSLFPSSDRQYANLHY